MRLGSKRELQLEDFYAAERSDRAKLLGDTLELEWNKELLYAARVNAVSGKTERYVPNFGKAVLKWIGPKYFLGSILGIFDECVCK